MAVFGSSHRARNLIRVRIDRVPDPKIFYFIFFSFVELKFGFVVVESPARLDRVGSTWRIFQSTHGPIFGTCRGLSCTRGRFLAQEDRPGWDLLEGSKLTTRLC